MGSLTEFYIQLILALSGLTSLKVNSKWQLQLTAVYLREVGGMSHGARPYMPENIDPKRFSVLAKGFKTTCTAVRIGRQSGLLSGMAQHA